MLVREIKETVLIPSIYVHEKIGYNAPKDHAEGTYWSWSLIVLHIQRCTRVESTHGSSWVKSRCL